MQQIITILIALAISSTIMDPPNVAAADAAEQLMVLYSNNVNGKTEPCG